MTRHLPSKPNLVQLKHQAKNLLKAHRRGERSACRTLRLLRRFSGQSDEAILSAALTLAEAQYALAMDYGFESWTALKNRVAPAPTSKAEADAPRPGRPYSYTAVTLGRQVQTGVVNARNSEDAVAKMRRDGVIPVSLQKQGATQEEGLTGSPKGQAAAAARRAVELILLSSLAAADREVRFVPGRPPFRAPDGTQVTCSPSFWLRGPAQKVAAVPFPQHIGGPELLEALREMSGERRLGRGSARVRRAVTIGGDLPDGIPRRVDLLFRSDRQGGTISVTLMKPGSRGATRAPLEKIVKAILRALGRYRKVHVLTPPRLQAHPQIQEIAKGLAGCLDEKKVAVLDRSASSLPDEPVVVAEAGGMALLLIQAWVRGEAAAAAFERTLAGTLAVCVDLTDDCSWQPSTITDDEGNLVASAAPGALLMLYGKVREFRQTDGK